MNQVVDSAYLPAMILQRPRLATAALIALSTVAVSAAVDVTPAAHAAAPGTTVPVSTTVTGVPSISSNGRYVVFTSGPTDHSQILLWDRKTKTTRTVAANNGVGRSYEPSISPDGRYVGYVSEAANMIPGSGADQGAQVLLWDRTTGVTTPVTQPTSDGTGNYLPRVSNDARFVAYVTEPGTIDTETTYVWNRVTGSARPVSPAGYEVAFPRGISDDGRYVLVDEARSSESEESTEFLVDRITGRSRTVGGDFGFLSGNGRYVVHDAYKGDGSKKHPFHSYPVIWDRHTGKTTSLHVAAKYAKNASLRWGYTVAGVSTTGRYVLVLINNKNAAKEELVLLDRAKGTTTLVTKRPGYGATVSGNGRYIAFEKNRHAEAGYQYGVTTLKFRES
jgi:hypothetical protein